jgi:hypothetical protein
VINKTTEVDYLAKFWRKFEELTKNALMFGWFLFTLRSVGQKEKNKKQKMRNY